MYTSSFVQLSLSMDLDRQGKWHRLKGIFLLLLLLLLIACLFTYVYFVHDQLFNGPKALGGGPF